jgi:hypothetical protein
MSDNAQPDIILHVVGRFLHSLALLVMFRFLIMSKGCNLMAAYLSPYVPYTGKVKKKKVELSP